MWGGGEMVFCRCKEIFLYFFYKEVRVGERRGRVRVVFDRLKSMDSLLVVFIWSNLG